MTTRKTDQGQGQALPLQAEIEVCHPPEKALNNKVFSALALVLITAIGAWFRFTHLLDWDGGYQLHPDERGILFIAQTIELRAEDGSIRLAGLNPYRNGDGEQRSYAYGHLPLYASAGLERVLSLPCKLNPEWCERIRGNSTAGMILNSGGKPRFDHLLISGRLFSAFCDTLTILSVALLAGRLFRRWAGVFSAALCASAVTHIQNAHFGTVDTSLALFATLTLWALVRYSETGKPGDSLLAGVFAGLAASCKITGALLVIPIIAAHVSKLTTRLTIPGAKATGPQSMGRQPDDQWLGRPQGPPLQDGADAAVFWFTILKMGVAFGLTSPYAILDPAPFFEAAITQAGMASGRLDWTFTRQYAGTWPLIYHIGQQARWTLGLPTTIACYAGLIGTMGLAIRTKRRKYVIVSMWAAVFLLLIGTQFVKFPRYMLPVTPTLIAAAGGIYFAVQNRLSGSVREIIAAAAAILISVPNLIYAAAFVKMYEEPHPWISASEWIYQEVPPGSHLVLEYRDDALPLDLNQENGELIIREATYQCEQIDLYAEPDDADKIQSIASTTAEADYIIIASNRIYGTITRNDERYPYTAGYYSALFGGELGYILDNSFSRYPNIFDVWLIDDPVKQAGLTIPAGLGFPNGLSPGFADESFTVYDHPLVLIFKNEKGLSSEQIEAAIVAKMTSNSR
ncbi:MAG: glycosyltransferase family 39 protein [Anaerolineae bacterium]|nr:glycosyltransferase family 39 protein [Anaerolineae bacterium]